MRRLCPFSSKGRLGKDPFRLRGVDQLIIMVIHSYLRHKNSPLSEFMSNSLCNVRYITSIHDHQVMFPHLFRGITVVLFDLM